MDEKKEIVLRYNSDTRTFEKYEEPYAIVECPTEEDFNRLKEKLDFFKKHQWISVEERLPEHEDRVLVACRTKKGAQSINLAYHSDGFWHGQGSMSGVTHWMPLPDLPEVS